MQNPIRLNRSVKHWRMLDWLLIALVLAGLVWLMAPQQLPVSVYKLSLVAMAAVAGYWIDRSLFPYARPDQFLADDDGAAEPDGGPGGPIGMLEVVSDASERLLAAAMLRRAIIVGAAMLAAGLGA